MDEVELVVKGSIDRWRIERKFAYYQTISAGTMKPVPTIKELFPLPYDDEIKEESNESELTEFYKKFEGQL